MHNSTGPINYRTFYLPANGVMQICDNKAHLGKIYELDKEVVGFDTVEECIDRCRYYLAHDDERRAIAAAGWRRAMRDYTEVPIFRRMVETVSSMLPPRDRPAPRVHDIITRQREATRLRRAVHTVSQPLMRPLERAFRLAAAVRDRARRMLGR
jgi:spore maturation protein CgeB